MGHPRPKNRSCGLVSEARHGLDKTVPKWRQSDAKAQHGPIKFSSSKPTRRTNAPPTVVHVFVGACKGRCPLDPHDACATAGPSARAPRLHAFGAEPLAQRGAGVRARLMTVPCRPPLRVPCRSAPLWWLVYRGQGVAIAIAACSCQACEGRRA
jgi:hypothetical protein